jgi:hypothetical protein
MTPGSGGSATKRHGDVWLKDRQVVETEMFEYS